MRWRSAALGAVLVAAVPVACAQDSKAPPAKAAVRKDDRQALLEEMIQDFMKARKEAAAAFRTAQTAEDEKAARDKAPKEADFLPRVHKLIAGGAKDEVAAEAVAFAVFGLDTKDEKVFDALKAYAKTDTIRRFVQMATTGAPDAAKPVLEQVLADNPSKDLKGMACYALGAMAFEQEDGKGAKEAERYFDRVEKEFADVPGPQKRTLGEMAKGSLFELRNLQVGMPAPPAESKDLKGEKATLTDLKGKVVVLDFWATWCGPCKAMIPHEREMVEKLRDKPFALVSVSVDDEKKELTDFLQTEKMPWTHWWDGPESPLIRQWNIRYFPTIYVIDAKGVIRHKNLRGEELEKAVEKLVAEAKP
ncbi:MAG: TlpA family protein disulfide reductase [Zavarzinella sp.]|nr:TlpA family protein disulfide reductase [Zavarzinella sp.]